MNKTIQEEQRKLEEYHDVLLNEWNIYTTRRQREYSYFFYDSYEVLKSHNLSNDEKIKKLEVIFEQQRKKHQKTSDLVLKY